MLGRGFWRTVVATAVCVTIPGRLPAAAPPTDAASESESPSPGEGESEQPPADESARAVEAPTSVEPDESADEQRRIDAAAVARAAQEMGDADDHAGASDRWAQAYAMYPDKKLQAFALGRMAYHALLAFPNDNDVERLQRAKRLLEEFLGTLGDLWDDDQLRSDLKPQLEKIDAQLEREQQPRVITKEIQVPTAVPISDRRADKMARAFVISGGVAAGAGVVLLGVMAYGLAAGAQADEDGETAREDDTLSEAERITAYQRALDDGVRANNLALASGVTGGILAAAGAALLAYGLVKRRELMAGPALAPNTAGIAVWSRF